MKTFLVLIILAIVGVTAWYLITQHKETEVVTVTTVNTDTLTVVKDSIVHSGNFDTVPAGFYQGMLPCNGCEGLQRTIFFENDGSYRMEELDWGKSAIPRKSEGSWSQDDNNKFSLTRNGKKIAQYKLIRDSLINTENNNIKIADSLSTKYVLFKKNTGPENASWQKRKSEGIDIVGTGTEPFWSIEIDKEKLILFRLLGVDKPVIVPIEKPSISKDSTTYSVKTDGGVALKISISSAFCGDGMSDHLYQYKMNVYYLDKVYKGCAVMLSN